MVGAKRSDPPPQLDSVIGHVLIADLVDYSTLHMEEQERVDRELRESVMGLSAFQQGLGSNMISIDTGDGVALVFFDEPCAPALAALQLMDCRGPSPDSSIRIGLHSGPLIKCIDISGKQNVKGVGINVARRVLDCAEPGAICLTEHYASILRSYQGWSDRILERGLYTVKHGLRLRICEIEHVHRPARGRRGPAQGYGTSVRAARFGMAVFVAFGVFVGWVASRSSGAGEPAALGQISAEELERVRQEVRRELILEEERRSRGLARPVP